MLNFRVRVNITPTPTGISKTTFLPISKASRQSYLLVPFLPPRTPSRQKRSYFSVAVVSERSSGHGRSRRGCTEILYTPFFPAKLGNKDAATTSHFPLLRTRAQRFLKNLEWLLSRSSKLPPLKIRQPSVHGSRQTGAGSWLSWPVNCLV